MKPMRLIRRLNPLPGIADFWREFSRPQPYRLPILGVSMLMTFGLLYLFTEEKVVGPPPSPTVTYITSFAPDRTDAEIIETNIENQRKKDEREAEFLAREERRKEMYRALARASGMDPEEIERQAAEEAAREEAAAASADSEAANTGSARPDAGTTGGDAAE